MAPFSVRDEAEARVVLLDDTVALNDFRSNSYRDSLYQVVDEHDGGRVALDLGAVDYLSSSGVAILVGLKRRLERSGGKLVLFGVQPMVLELLRITRLTQYFTFADDEKAALELLRPLPTA